MRCFLFFASLAFVGCASTMAPVPTAQRRVGEEPLLNTRATRSVGDVIYATYNYEEVVVARIEALVDIDVMAARATIPSGTALERYEDRETSAFCTRDLALVVTFSGPMSRVCLADRNRNRKFDAWKAPQGPLARQAWANLEGEIGYSIGSSIGTTSQGFRYELLYQGLSGNVVSLLYREYTNDLVRPAFQQDLTYTLSDPGPTEITFRRTRVRVFSADNNSIVYELLSSMI